MAISSLTEVSDSFQHGNGLSSPICSYQSHGVPQNIIRLKHCGVSHRCDERMLLNLALVSEEEKLRMDATF